MAARHAGWLAGALFASAVAGFALLPPGYSHLQHPVALLGAGGVPGAAAFNALGLVLPGLLAAAAALAVYRDLPPAAGWGPRIGARMLLLSALAFAAQGLLPLDLRELDGGSGRLHGSAWLLWLLAFLPGVLLLATVPRLRVAGVLAAIAAGALALLPLEPLPRALAQRLAFAAWFVWLAVAPWLRRDATAAQP
ncbi:DUF998 domain-containing protein [Luteimonas sp. RD2P54]|uniref:DUF998 domain-containing protein n=1 Tax=Luteimonas endophytica TaxID=3042023 RepID=A0ABT6J972_9GAMM|nr:DUF998 domain-containing protein [Luteimonas endophytica]MDH5823371.1 DUF998 domain-containing protein [Luteimonas endophytica]